MLKKISILLILACLMLINPLFATAKSNISAQELESMQTKTYNNVPTEKVMKALINVLQDKFYFIENADSKIGFILASREFDTNDKTINIKEEFGARKLMTMIKLYSTSRTEANINVTSMANSTKIKISFRRKVINIYNTTRRIQELTEEKYYSGFFSTLDKELKIDN